MELVRNILLSTETVIKKTETIIKKLASTLILDDTVQGFSNGFIQRWLSSGLQCHAVQ
jgi:hypothetical protein